MNHHHNSHSKLWAWADVQRNSVQDSMPACSGWVRCLPNPHEADCGASAYISVCACVHYLFIFLYVHMGGGKILNCVPSPRHGETCLKKKFFQYGCWEQGWQVRKEEPVFPIYPKTFGHIGEKFSITGHCTPIRKHNVESPTMQEKLSTGD